MKVLRHEQRLTWKPLSYLGKFPSIQRVSDEWWEPLSKTQIIASSSNVSLVSALSNAFDLWIKTPPCPYLVCPEWTNPSSNITLQGVTEAPLVSFFNSSASVFSRSTSQLLTGGNLAPQEVMRRASWRNRWPSGKEILFGSRGVPKWLDRQFLVYLFLVILNHYFGLNQFLRSSLLFYTFLF